MSVVFNFSRFPHHLIGLKVVDGGLLIYPYPYTGPPVTFRLEEIGEADFTGYLANFWTPRLATLMPNLRRVKFPSYLYSEVSAEEYFAILRARKVELCWA